MMMVMHLILDGSRSKPNFFIMEQGGVWCDKNLAMIQSYTLSNYTVNDVYTPMSYKDAVSCDDAVKWKCSMD